jgi:hypothetical protein
MVTPMVYRPKDAGDRLLGLQIALKVADIGSICRPLEVAMKAIKGLEEEFFSQGDEDQNLCMSITPLCYLTKAGVSKAQKGFIIATPIVHNFVHVFTECDPLLTQLKLNSAVFEMTLTNVSEQDEYQDRKN